MVDPQRSPQAHSTCNSARPSRRSSTGPLEILRETVSGSSQLSVINDSSRLSIGSNLSDVLLADSSMQPFSIEIPSSTPPAEIV